MNRNTRFLADEDFDNDIVRGVLRRVPDADIVRVQDGGLSGAHDALVLERAALHGRIILTHDVTTMKPYAYARVSEGLSMPAVFVVGHSVSIAATIEAICLLAECSLPNEWDVQVRHLPL